VSVLSAYRCGGSQYRLEIGHIAAASNVHMAVGPVPIREVDHAFKGISRLDLRGMSVGRRDEEERSRRNMVGVIGRSLPVFHSSLHPSHSQPYLQQYMVGSSPNSAFEQASPHCIGVGSQTDLSDLNVKRD
jgi:hypothetical protein